MLFRSAFGELAATPPDGWLPATYTLGAIYDTGGSDQYGPADDRVSHYELYGMIDQAIVASDAGDPVLGAFLRVSGSTQDRLNVVGLYADGGIAWYGPIASRPDDVLGLAASILRFTSDYRARQQSVGTPVGAGETVLELTYQAEIGRAHV